MALLVGLALILSVLVGIFLVGFTIFLSLFK